MNTDGAGVREICRAFGHERTRLLDIVHALHAAKGQVAGADLDELAAALGMPRVEIEGVVSFYAFFSDRLKGRVVIRLCDDIIDEMFGMEPVARAFEKELGIGFGQTTPDGRITLEHTPCIGMCDQAPAALVNDVVVTYLSTDKVRELVRTLRETGDPRRLVFRLGDGNNAHPRVRAMVHNGIRRRGPVIFAPDVPGDGLRKAMAMSPAEVIRDVKTARLRGRGGAGFPTGMKWEFVRAAGGPAKYVLGNADEGEPGTFKDRVILTERADLMFEGMTIAGYATGAREGILYLRGEYAYLRDFLEDTLAARRAAGLLGPAILRRKGFDFDVRIQLGAGAYVCGEETAMISSCEGGRGDPKNRPPFPAQRGYLGFPTTVNNVETFCCVARILQHGPGWFAQMGSKGSPGTKLLSISGDCASPGVYEYPFGTPLAEILRDAGAEDAQAVQVGGPSGRMVGPADFGRTLCYDDLSTGGSVMVFGSRRNLVHVVRRFLEFFVHESCGHCTPCRVGNVLLKRKLDELLEGRGAPADLDYLARLGATVKAMSRCGLGQTSPNPVLSSLAAFRPAYEALLPARPDPVFLPTFDLRRELEPARALVGRDAATVAAGEDGLP